MDGVLLSADPYYYQITREGGGPAIQRRCLSEKLMVNLKIYTTSLNEMKLGKTRQEV